MTVQENAIGMVSLSDSERILHAIYPNYPSLDVRNPVPAIERQGDKGKAEKHD